MKIKAFWKKLKPLNKGGEGREMAVCCRCEEETVVVVS